MSKQPVVQLRTRAGRPVTTNGVTVTPLSKALTVRLPMGGFAWNRPIAVLVERDGHRERIPILDVTRIAQLCMLVCGLAMLTLGRRLTRRR